jgi:N-dimethylarginine dimethylaminohydrolase
MITRPPESIGHVTDPRGALMRGPVRLAAIRDQAMAVADAFRGAGVVVHVAEPPAQAPPNVVFLRDLFFMTPQGAILARPAAAQRAGEERYSAHALTGCGLPILCTLTGTATFEGADALWLDPDTVLLGVGFRTNSAGAHQVARVLAEQAVTVLTVPLPPGVQHLLGAVTFLTERLAAVHALAADATLRGVLGARGYRLLELPANDDLLLRRGMNLVTLAPGRVLMPAGAPTIRRALAAAGVEAHEIDVAEYLNADGALGCLTGIVERDGCPSEGEPDGQQSV